ncbi:MAG: hypothetical protein JXQ29_02990 [Planctomycetes bacterium]|nr:hypothetical protein [Planctomycetota bacterium]
MRRTMLPAILFCLLLGTALPAQSTLQECHARTGIAVVAAQQVADREIKNAMVGLLTSMGEKEFASEFRQTCESRKILEDHVVKKALRNQFEIEVYFPPYPDRDGHAYRYLDNFKSFHAQVPRDWPIYLLFEKGAPRKVIRIWQDPKLRKNDLADLVRRGLEEHYLSTDVGKLLKAASRYEKSSHLSNAALTCERILAIPTALEDEKQDAQELQTRAVAKLEELWKKKQFKTHTGWRDPRASSDGPKDERKATAGMRVKKLHQFLSVEIPADAAWKDPADWQVAAKVDGEVVVLTHVQFYEIQPGVQLTVTIGNRPVDPSNLSGLAKESQNTLDTHFKKVSKSTKPKKYRVASGKCHGFDSVVQGPEDQYGHRLAQDFTDTAASVDATRPYSPRDMEVYFRELFILGKHGTHSVVVMGTPGFFAKNDRVLQKMISSLAAD